MTAKRAKSDNWLMRRVHAVRRRPHFSSAIAIFLVMLATMIGAGADLARGMLLAFDIAASIYLVSVAVMFARSTVQSIRARAAEQDAGRWGVLWSSVVIASVALVALGKELGVTHEGGAFEIVLAAISLLLSWFFLNSVFALHYAHEYYGGEAKQPALSFPSEKSPDYWDFVYFAFVLGMTFQVSDVSIASRSVRRVALVHGIVAFFFNVVIVALSVNVAAGKF